MKETISREDFISRAKQTNFDFAKKLKLASFSHIDSFNYIYDEGLKKITQYLSPVDIIKEQRSDDYKQSYLPFNSMKIWIEDLQITNPTRAESGVGEDNKLMPEECRISRKTYGAPLIAKIARSIDGEKPESINILLGDIPIIVRSDHCHLSKLTPKELVKAHEDCNEFGGYFIVNGNEKIIRMLILQKRNYPIAFIRAGYITRGPNYTPFAVQMKCMREDLYSKTITLHYVSDGSVFLRILHRKQEFLIPAIVILKALVDVSDLQVYNKLVKGQSGKSTISDRVEVLIRGSKAMSLNTRDECLTHLGKNFRVVLSITNPEVTDKQVGEIFMNENICVHLKQNIDKFNTICVMINKLYALVSDEISPDNLDSLQNQEILLPGHLYMMILRERLEEMLLGIRAKVFKDGSRAEEAIKIPQIQYLKKAIEFQGSVGHKLEYFLSTGNLKSQTGLDLMQAKGFTIIADKLNNMRYLSHFRSVHRGAYFTEMKTTTVRKLLPENWGFVCPVHTPDGGPCGLLNHLSQSCKPMTRPGYDINIHCDLVKLSCELGMNPTVNDLSIVFPPSAVTVMLDGRVIGYIEQKNAQTFCHSLKYLKIVQDKTRLVPADLEIGYVPRTGLDKQHIFPGIFLATNEARFVRPVKHLKMNMLEWISPFEQVHLSIACLEEDIRNDTEYQELNPAFILSILPSQIPFLNYNQSPRNMYQCQMAKQTMGTSMHNFPYRFDNRIYRLLGGQIPMVKGMEPENYGLPDYPSGTNAIVAVISYTGYDMEDAMILNKSSYERGFGHGCVYKNYSYDVAEFNKEKQSKFKMLHQVKNIDKSQIAEGLENDGIPAIGSVIKKGTPVFQLYDTQKNAMKTFYHKDSELGRLDGIALVHDEKTKEPRVEYRVRIPRNPIIGDKFSSRHGQKGVLSVLWPHIDMPFTESGLSPDIIINPHAFPSRMTIGMLIESMAGKSGALNGSLLETQPFQNYQDDDIVNYFGKQLTQHGYNYYGNEVMYSGTYGCMMKVDIFMGVVYYQRLRHMVSDKAQARSTGPVDMLTQQPIKGRKRGGGIRMGEMERDALLSHGIQFCLHDRFMNCSDYSEGYVCNKCGSLISTYLHTNLMSGEALDNFYNYNKGVQKSKPKCRKCSDSSCSKVAIPFVLRYLTNELAAMNIKLSFKLE